MKVGDDLSLRAIISQMVRRERAWVAVSFSCERVMLQKEEVKIQRQKILGERMPPGNNDDGGGDGGLRPTSAPAPAAQK